MKKSTTQISTSNKSMDLPRGDSPAEMIRMAVSGGADLEKMERLLDLQMKWEQNEAKKAYVQAMSAFKENAPIVTRDKSNNQYRSKYTSLGNLVNTVNPELSKHGLSASWDITQNGIITVTCKMTHKLGHSESASASAPADTSGAKNAIQQIKSSVTYLKAVTFEAITGLASTDANCDDDGNAVGVEVIDEKQVGVIRDYMNSLNITDAQFKKAFQGHDVEGLPKKDYQRAITAFKAREKQNGNA